MSAANKQLLAVDTAFHDIGWTVQAEEHKRAGAVIVRQVLPTCGFSEIHVEIIRSGASPFFLDPVISAGTYHVRLTLESEGVPARLLLFDQEILLQTQGIYTVGVLPGYRFYCRGSVCLH